MLVWIVMMCLNFQADAVYDLLPKKKVRIILSVSSLWESLA